MLKIKDLYYLGVSILEFMLGRTNKDKMSVSIESIPSSWSKNPSSSSLIQIVSICLSLDIKNTSEKRLEEVIRLA